MGKPDDSPAANYDGPTYEPPAYESESLNAADLQVNIDDLVNYHDQMMALAMEASSAAATELTPIAQLVRDAFTASPMDLFAEGAILANKMLDRFGQMQLGQQDMSNGLQFGASAAAVIAERFENADSINAASIGDVRFAFGDRNAPVPEGFRPTETWTQYAARMAQQQDGSPMSLSGDEGTAVTVTSANGANRYTFKDGSYREVTIPRSLTPNGDMTVVTTTYYAKDGQVLQTIVERSAANYQAMEVRRGDGDQATVSTTTTITDPAAGTKTVSNETRIGNGAPVTSEPVTVAIDGHRGDANDGPVERKMNDWGTRGSGYFVRDHGPAI